jgi:hypothetical protein
VSKSQTVTLTASQVESLAAAMLSVARVDGVHPAEEALIANFCRENGGGSAPDLDRLHGLMSAPQALSSLAGDSDFAEAVLRMCVMTGYADGHLSETEWAHIQSLSAQLKVNVDRVQGIRTEVKDLLVASLSHLPVAESVAAVAKTL